MIFWHVFTSIPVRPRGGQSLFSSERAQLWIRMHVCTCAWVPCCDCHSAITFLGATRRPQTEKLPKLRCEKGCVGRGEGCGAWAARWRSVPRAGTACWHSRSQTSGPLYSQMERGEGHGGRQSNPVRTRALFVLSILLWSHWRTSSLSLRNFVMFV